MFLSLLLFVAELLASSLATDVGDPLLLTGLLEEGKYLEARELSRVTPDIGDTTSYSGFFTVDKECETNLFFWFTPAQNRSWQDAPVLFWQQGGPGSTSFYGMFEELGPAQYSKMSGLTKRQYSWSEENNLLIIDNPAGVGYSFSGKECYPDDEEVLAKSWYKALTQFYQLFPELQRNAFVLSGESYAGHTVPLYGYTIHKHNPTAEVKVNLTGMLILSTWSDPISQVDYGTLYYQLGLIDDAQRDTYDLYQRQCVKAITLQQWYQAYFTCNLLTECLYGDAIGNVNFYNFFNGTNSVISTDFEDFVQSDEVRKQLHVGNLKYNIGLAFQVLKYNTYKSVKPYVEQLLDHYPMVFVNGQLDLICPYSLAVNFLRSMKWSGSSTYLAANRKHWCYQEELVGYYKKGGNLHDFLLRGAGHFIPKDKPSLAYLLVNSLTSGFPSRPLRDIQVC